MPTLNAVKLSTHGKLSGFTNVSSTQTVRQRLRSAVKYNLEQITVANGYYTNVRRVSDPPISNEKINEYAHINIHWGREDRTSEHLAANNSLIDIRFTYELDCFLKDINDQALAQDRMLADVQKLFGSNYYIVGEDGVRSAFNCVYLGSDAWGVESGNPKCGITIELEVWYNYKLTDPTNMC